MCNLNEIIVKSVELNNAIKKLNEQTKIINSITAEKRKAKKEDIANYLQKYVRIMEMLDIDTITIKTNVIMHYNELDRLMGIKIRRHEYGIQIDLGCLSTVNSGFYAYHSIGWVVSGVKNEAIMNGFCDEWNDIRNNLDVAFSKAVEALLNSREKKAIAERERAIHNLTAISN